MANIPLSNEPLSIQEMWLPESLRDWIQNRIKETPDLSNLNDIPNLLFITGSSGAGKGTLVRNLIRAIHCPNREINQGKGCGNCSNCKSDPREQGELGNVVWVECGSRQGDSDYKKVKDAINISYKGPLTTGNPHRDILFVVFDEVHLLKSVDQSALLTISEHNASDVKYICITAEPEEMKSKVRKMLKSRGAHLNLPEPTPSLLFDYLLSKSEKLNQSVPEETLKIIANHSEGSYREAVSHLYYLSQYDSSLSPDTASLVLQTLTWSERKSLWEELTDKYSSRKRLRSLIEKIKRKADDRTLAGLLLEDLYDSDTANEQDNLLGIRLLSEWMRRPFEQDIKYVLIQLKGLKCVDLDQMKEDTLKRSEIEELYAPTTND